MRPKSSPADQPNIQEDHSPQVPDVDEVKDTGVEEVGMEDVENAEIEGHNDSGLESVVDLDLEELIYRLLKTYM